MTEQDGPMQDHPTQVHPIGAAASDLVRLGLTGPRVAAVGTGTWAWGDTTYWGYGRSYGEADVADAYTAARAAGVTFFDTAETYGSGTAESLLGRFLAADPTSAEVVVASKFAAFPWRAGRRGPLLRALDASLTRLGRDRLDLYQIHWPLPVVGDGPWLADLAAAVDAGRIGSVGVSNYGPQPLRAAHATLARHGVALATNQVEYSLLCRKPEQTGLLDACRELGVTLIAYSPLAQGLLTGKYGPASRPRGVRSLKARRRLAGLPGLVGLLSDIGAQHGKTAAQVALNWLIGHGVVPIAGAKNPAQARENAGVLGWRLPADQAAALDNHPTGDQR